MKVISIILGFSIHFLIYSLTFTFIKARVHDSFSAKGRFGSKRGILFYVEVVSETLIYLDHICFVPQCNFTKLQTQNTIPHEGHEIMRDNFPGKILSLLYGTRV